jgi:hypothetical protein
MCHVTVTGVLPRRVIDGARFFGEFADFIERTDCNFALARLNQHVPPVGRTKNTVPLPTLQGGLHTMGKAATMSNSKKAPSKSEVLANISEATGVAKKDVGAVLESLANEIKKALGNKGPGTFAIPGLVKIEKKKVPARPAKKGVPNPFKPGELMDVAAKPASTKIKVRALKNLKSMA